MSDEPCPRCGMVHATAYPQSGALREAAERMLASLPEDERARTTIREACFRVTISAAALCEGGR